MAIMADLGSKEVGGREMRTVTSRHFRNHQGEVLDSVRDGPILVTKRDRRRVLLVSAHDWHDPEELDEFLARVANQLKAQKAIQA
jgi:prevent-host-death family protein